MTILYTDSRFLDHETGNHPECPDRLRAITAGLRKAGLIEKCAAGKFKPATEEKIAQVHDGMQVLAIKHLVEHGGGLLEADTPVSQKSLEVALLAAGAAVAAVEAVVKGDRKNALCLIRPPGHHATHAHSMGFCLFNNIALAVHHALAVHQMTRVLVVDWDVHHGNGTQDIFYQEPRVLFMSIHRYGHGFYPGTGAKNETGQGRGLGFTSNVPVAFGTSRKAYHDHFKQALEHAADKIKPELVLISAGFDADARDPIGSLGLETEDFQALTRAVLAIADSHAHGKVVSCLEGGYDLQALAEGVQAHLGELLAAS
jgi:acetoin utilization deacetylase AcuC-like enzyme